MVKLATVKISAFYLDRNPPYGPYKDTQKLKKNHLFVEKTNRIFKIHFFNTYTKARKLKFLSE